MLGIIQQVDRDELCWISGERVRSAHREPFPGVEIFQRHLAMSMTAASLTLEPFSWTVAVYSNVDAALPWLARLDA